jgi:hypothetical protein
MNFAIFSLSLSQCEKVLSYLAYRKCKNKECMSAMLADEEGKKRAFNAMLGKFGAI